MPSRDRAACPTYPPSMSEDPSPDHPAPGPRTPRAILVVLLVLNSVVQLGQVWPEGAPPFARGVNIAFLLATFIYFLSELRPAPSRPPGR